MYFKKNVKLLSSFSSSQDINWSDVVILVYGVSWDFVIVWNVPGFKKAWKDTTIGVFIRTDKNSALRFLAAATSQLFPQWRAHPAVASGVTTKHIYKRFSMINLKRKSFSGGDCHNIGKSQRILDLLTFHLEASNKNLHFFSLWQVLLAAFP